VREAIAILDKFRKATGLQLNKNKTIGLVTNKSLNTKDIWDIQWHTEQIDPLNITIGPPKQ